MAVGEVLTPMEDAALACPSAETRLLNVTDLWLRKHGFQIVSRRKNDQPVWKLGDVRYTQLAAIRYCDDLAEMGKCE